MQPHLYLSKQDPRLAVVIKQVGIIVPRKKSQNHFKELVESIISQQLSVKASDTIFKRFCALFPSGKFPKPEALLQMTDSKIRACGLSNSKVSFVKDLATRVVDGRLHFRGIDKMTDEEVIAMLVVVKGIGRWTAEMFLMFALQRPDIFSHGDLGLRNDIVKLYKIKGHLSEKRALLISKKWSPHRTLACRYLWASLTLK